MNVLVQALNIWQNCRQQMWTVKAKWVLFIIPIFFMVSMKRRKYICMEFSLYKPIKISIVYKAMGRQNVYHFIGVISWERFQINILSRISYLIWELFQKNSPNMVWSMHFCLFFFVLHSCKNLDVILIALFFPSKFLSKGKR